jgi:hypothetical protein
MHLQVASETLDLNPGDAYMIPGGAEHEATALDQPLIKEGNGTGWEEGGGFGDGAMPAIGKYGL